MPNVYLLEIEWDKLRDLIARRSLPLHNHDNSFLIEHERAEASLRLANAGIMPVSCQADIEAEAA